MARIQEVLTELVASAVEPLGYELLGLEYMSQGRHSILRIYIDSPDGITLEDCEKASRQVSAVMDVEDPIKGEYSLELSSPGLDRPLFSLKHYEQFTGSKVKLRLHVAIEGRRKYTGVIKGIEDERVVIGVLENDSEQEIIRVPLENIDKANLVVDI
jgi:ribosome maturation factor RimP